MKPRGQRPTLYSAYYRGPVAECKKKEADEYDPTGRPSGYSGVVRIEEKG